MRGESEDNEWRERWDDQICKTTCLFSLCLFFRYIFIYFFSSLLPFSPLFSLVLLSRQTDCDTHAHTRVAPSPVGPPHISLILPRSMRVMVVLPCRRRLTMCVHNHITLGPKLMFLARTPLKLGLCPSALPPRRLQNDEESQGGLDSYVWKMMCPVKPSLRFSWRVENWLSGVFCIFSLTFSNSKKKRGKKKNHLNDRWRLFLCATKLLQTPESSGSDGTRLPRRSANDCFHLKTVREYRLFSRLPETKEIKKKNKTKTTEQERWWHFLTCFQFLFQHFFFHPNALRWVLDFCYPATSILTVFLFQIDFAPHFAHLQIIIFLYRSLVHLILRMKHSVKFQIEKTYLTKTKAQRFSPRTPLLVCTYTDWWPSVPFVVA